MCTYKQNVTQSVAAECCANVSVQVAVEMPFDIKKIHSPTHRLRVKVRYHLIEIFFIETFYKTNT